MSPTALNSFFSKYPNWVLKKVNVSKLHSQSWVELESLDSCWCSKLVKHLYCRHTNCKYLIRAFPTTCFHSILLSISAARPSLSHTVLSHASAYNKSPQFLLCKEEATIASFMLFPWGSLDPFTHHLREVDSIHASSGHLGLELAKPSWLEEELEKIQVFARGPDDWFWEPKA